MSTNEPKELELLLSEEKAGDYTVNAWTLKQWVAMYPYLQTVFAKLKEDGCNFGNFETFMADNPVALIDAVIPVIIPVLAISLKADEDEVSELDMPTAVSLAIKVFAKNIGHLKNFFGQIKGESLAETK